MPATDPNYQFLSYVLLTTNIPRRRFNWRGSSDAKDAFEICRDALQAEKNITDAKAIKKVLPDVVMKLLVILNDIFDLEFFEVAHLIDDNLITPSMTEKDAQEVMWKVSPQGRKPFAFTKQYPPISPTNNVSGTDISTSE